MRTGWIAVVWLLAVALGCGAPSPGSNKGAIHPVVADDPVAALRSALPEGWEISKVETGAYPWNRKPGTGTEVYLVEKGKRYLKQQFSAVVWIMPPDYVDNVTVMNPMEAQTNPPDLIAGASNGKVYLWGGDEKIKEVILRALMKEKGR